MPESHHIKDMLRQAGLKATPQRMAICELLVQGREHLSAELIYKEIARQMPSLSVATVYKILDSLCEAGLARQVFAPGGTQHFEAVRDHHHHLYCSRTQAIADYEDEGLTEMIQQYLAQHAPPGFQVKNFTLHIEGEFQEGQR